jgi:hypothetical protein
MRPGAIAFVSSSVLTSGTNISVSAATSGNGSTTSINQTTVPMGFQASIASTNVGDTAYSPIWRIQATTWKDPSHVEFLTTVAQITSAAQAGKLDTKIPGVVINCPIVNVAV